MARQEQLIERLEARDIGIPTDVWVGERKTLVARTQQAEQVAYAQRERAVKSEELAKRWAARWRALADAATRRQATLSSVRALVQVSCGSIGCLFMKERESLRYATRTQDQRAAGSRSSASSGADWDFAASPLRRVSSAVGGNAHDADNNNDDTEDGVVGEGIDDDNDNNNNNNYNAANRSSLRRSPYSSPSAARATLMQTLGR